MDPGQRREAERHAAPPADVVHEAVRADGEDTLRRGTMALASSALAAGLSLGFSFFVPGLIQAHLPDAAWRLLLTALGYPVGFLIVILGRQQLFTQNTLTVVLPLLERRDAGMLGRVAHVWGVVLGANLLGALAVAWVGGRTPIFEPDTLRAFTAMGKRRWPRTAVRRCSVPSSPAGLSRCSSGSSPLPRQPGPG
jgi:formate/nitrite transporter FocA (FNT family)